VYADNTRLAGSWKAPSGHQLSLTMLFFATEATFDYFQFNLMPSLLATASSDCTISPAPGAFVVPKSSGTPALAALANVAASAYGGNGAACFYSDMMTPTTGVAWSLALSACPAGFFCADGAAAPTPCPAGSYSPAPGSASSASCLPCGAGLNSSAGAGACCALGSWSAPSSTACAACPAGTFSATQGAANASACLLCEAGRFSAAPGSNSSAACLACDAGSFSAGGATSCTSCAAGTFAKRPGAAACQACPGGHFCPAGTASWARLNCGRGNYCPDGSAAPLPCPLQVPPAGGWGALRAQGPAFLVETAHCRDHCFWNASSGDGRLSKC
jgi:hypothetical protein